MEAMSSANVGDGCHPSTTSGPSSPDSHTSPQWTNCAAHCITKVYAARLPVMARAVLVTRECESRTLCTSAWTSRPCSAVAGISHASVSSDGVPLTTWVASGICDNSRHIVSMSI